MVLEPGRQVSLDVRQDRVDPLDHVERVGIGQHPNAHEDRIFSGESNLGGIILRPKHDRGDVLEPHDGATLLADDQPLEFGQGPQVRVGREVDLDHRTHGLPERGKVIVRRQSLPHLGGADAERRHPVGLQPHPHREHATAEDVGALDSRKRRQARLDDAHQIIGDLVSLEDVRTEAEVGAGELGIGGLDVKHRHLGFRRQIAANLVDF